MTCIARRTNEFLEIFRLEVLAYTTLYFFIPTFDWVN